MNENNSYKDYACKYQAHYVSWVKKEINSFLKEKSSKGKSMSSDDICWVKALNILKKLAEKEDWNLLGVLAYLNITTNRLTEARPLTPIIGEENEWTFAFYSGDNGKDKVYQSKRYSPLFKCVKENGDIQYTDGDRYRNFDADADNPNNIVYIPDKLMQNLVDEMFPIEMPYYPHNNPYLVKAENIETTPRNSFIIKIEYILDAFWVKHNVDRYFLIDLDHNFTEISKETLDLMNLNYKKGQENEN